MLFSEHKVEGDAVQAVWALYGEIGCMVGK